MAETLEFQTLPKDPNLAESFDVYLCNNFSLPSFAIKFLKDEAKTYEARLDDIYVVSYPKTGTTWLQEIVYLVHSNLDFAGSKNRDLNERFPYVEHARTNISYVTNMPSPRLLKTHLPYSLLPNDIHRKQCKMLYITRNPRDVAVSYYHFARMLKETQYQGNFEQFFERFLSDRPTYGPFLLHNLEAWNHRNDKNILFLVYEELQKDLAGNIRKIAQFLDRSFTDKEINSIVEHCGFKNMAKNQPSTIEIAEGSDNNFFRKGKVGDWENYFTPEMISRMDKKVSEVLQDCGLKYTYELA